MRRFYSFGKRCLWVLLFITPVVLGAYYIGGNYLKKALVLALNEQLEVGVNVQSIRISGLHSFPHLGVRLQNVRIEESTIIYKQPLLSANEIILEFNPLKLLRGQNEIDKIEFNKGTIRIFKGANGESNFQLLKSGDWGENSELLNLNLKKVVLRDFTCVYLGEDGRHSANFYTNELVFSGRFMNDRFNMKMEGDALFDHLLVDHQNYIADKYAYFKLSVEIDQNIGSCHIEKANLKVDALEMQVSGDLLMAGNIPDLDLEVEGKNMDIQSLLSLLPNRQRYGLRDLQSTGKVSLSGHIKGRLEEGKLPKVNLSFGMTDIGLFLANEDFDVRHLALQGTITNQNEGDRLALHIDLNELRMPHSVVNGIFSLDDLENPVLLFQTKGHIDLHDIEGLAKSRIPKLQKLYGILRFNLKGEMATTSDGSTFDVANAETEGDLEVEDLVVRHLDTKIDHLYLKTRINGNRLTQSEFTGELFNNQVFFKGEVKNWQSLFFNNDRVQISGDLASQDLNINRLLSNHQNASEVGDKDETVNLDIGIDLDLKVSARRFEWDQLKTDDLTGHLIWEGSQMWLDDVKFKAWKGKNEGKAVIKPTSDGYELTALVDVEDVSIDQLFSDFNNFNQTEFNPEIIMGKITSDMDVRILFDRMFNVIGDSLQALANLTITDGRLKDYKPMQSLSSFVQLSELEDIRFERLSNTLEIRNGVVYIPEMSIRNNAINLEIGGSHNFDNYMDYKMKIRVTELMAGKSGWAKRKKEQQLEDDEGGGLSAYLLMSGTPEDLKIKYDVKGVKALVGHEIKTERKSFFKDVKKELKGQSIEKTDLKKSRWDE